MRFLFFFCFFLLAFCHNPAAQQSKAQLLATYEAHGCRGFCPVYKLVFYKDGKGRYEGIRNTVKKGTVDFRLTKAELAQLKNTLATTNVWQYPEEIRSMVADAPGGIITVYKKGQQKSVSGSIDRPKPLLELEALMQNLANAHGLEATTGVDPNEIPAGARSEVIVKLKKDLNAGNWIARFSDIRLRLLRRLGEENIWLVGYDAKQISEASLLDLLKSTEGVLEAQPNKKTEQRN